MNKRFPVNGCKHLWTPASDWDKYLATLNILFDSATSYLILQKIFEILVYKAIWRPWLEHDVAWESCFSKILQLVSTIFQLGLGRLEWQ